MMANFEFAREYGNSFDINNFISLANANPAAQSISRDLLIGASAIFIWIVNESKKLNIKNMWVVYIGTFLIAFAFSAPFFLFLRERRIIELDKINLNNLLNRIVKAIKQQQEIEIQIIEA